MFSRILLLVLVLLGTASSLARVPHDEDDMAQRTRHNRRRRRMYARKVVKVAEKKTPTKKKTWTKKTSTKQKPFTPNLWTFQSVLSAAQEVDSAGNIGRMACNSPGLGNAVARLYTNKLCIALSYTGLVGKETVSHIHGPARIGERGPNIFRLSPRPIKNDCFDLTWDQVKDLRKGLYYFNIHTTHCGESEIRGQILPIH